MAVQQYQLIFNCTPAQLETALVTTLPAAAFTVTRVPIKTTGIVQSGAPFTFTATTNSTTALTAVSSLAGLYPGIPVTGSGIPAGTTLSAIGATNTATLSQAATSGASGVTITATPNLGQIDFTYDGQYFLTFFGANLGPVVTQPNAGIPQTQMSPSLVTMLTNVLAATLGAPVPPNLAVPPSYVP